MSIYSEIDRLELAKQNLKLKLESKGITVPADARISDYAALINLLPEIKESEFTNRIVDNGNSGTGKAKIYNIKGKTLVWNQLVQNGNFVNTDIWVRKGAGFTVNNGIATIDYTNFGDNGVGQIVGTSELYNHKVMLLYEITSISGEWYCGIFRGEITNIFWSAGIAKKENTTGVKAYIFPINTSLDATNNKYCLGFGRADQAGRTISVKNVVCIDLTLMFGAGNEPATIEEFESIFPLPYYEYNAGTLINNDAEAIESIGFNQWDEEWEVGTIYAGTGENGDDSSYIRSKNYIPLLSGKTYYIKCPVAVRPRFYDANKSYIGYSDKNGNEVGNNSTFEPPTNAAYMRFAPQLTSYSYNICLNISDPYKNGIYEPYKNFTLPLGLNSFNVKDDEDNIITINGLKSTGNVYDEIVGNKFIKRVGSVDLGSLEWNYDQAHGTMYAPYPNDAKNAASYASLANITCEKYETSTLALLYNGKIGIAFSGQANMRVVVYDSSYLDKDLFKTAMSGVMLYYELATPIEYELVEEIDTIYDVDKNGVERIISPVHQDGSPSAPFRASIGYPVNQE